MYTPRTARRTAAGGARTLLRAETDRFGKESKERAEWLGHGHGHGDRDREPGLDAAERARGTGDGLACYRGREGKGEGGFPVSISIFAPLLNGFVVAPADGVLSLRRLTLALEAPLVVRIRGRGAASASTEARKACKMAKSGREKTTTAGGDCVVRTIYAPAASNAQGFPITGRDPRRRDAARRARRWSAWIEYMTWQSWRSSGLEDRGRRRLGVHPQYHLFLQMPDASKRSRKRAASVQLTASDLDSTQTPAMPDAEWIPEYKGWVTELGPLVKKNFPIPPEHLPLFDNFIARMIQVGRPRYEIDKVSQKIRAAKVGLLYKKDWNSLLSMFSAPARGHFGSPSSSASTVFPPVDKYPQALALIHQRLDKTDYRLDEGGPLLSAIAAAACDLRCGITVYTSPLMYSTSHSQDNYGTWASFLKCPRDYKGDISACLVGGYKLRRVGTALDQFFGQDFHVFLIIAIHPPRVGSPARRPIYLTRAFDVKCRWIKGRFGC